MARVDVTEADLLAALRDAATPHDPDDARTVMELADAMGMTEKRARAQVAALIRAGRVECVRVTRTAMDGRAAKVPAYRLTERAA